MCAFLFGAWGRMGPAQLQSRQSKLLGRCFQAVRITRNLTRFQEVLLQATPLEARTTTVTLEEPRKPSGKVHDPRLDSPVASSRPPSHPHVPGSKSVLQIPAPLICCGVSTVARPVATEGPVASPRLQSLGDRRAHEADLDLEESSRSSQRNKSGFRCYVSHVYIGRES